MSSFDLAINIVKADLKKLQREQPGNEHNIERARIVLDALRHGKKLEGLA